MWWANKRSALLAGYGEREGRYVCTGTVRDLGGTLLFYFVDANNGGERDEAPLYPREFIAKFIFARIDHHLRFFSENVIFDFDETK